MPEKLAVELVLCHIVVFQEEEGDYSAIALNLPGASGCGDNEDEAVASVLESVSALIESYKETGVAVPWKDSSGSEIPPGASQKWISVNA